MAVKIPLVITTGEIEQLQSGDTLAGITPGTTDNALVRADGTGNDTIQGSTAIVADTGALTLNSDSSLETSGAHGSTLTIVDSTSTNALEIQAFTAASDNMAIGVGAGASISSGTENVFIGTDSGAGIVTGQRNVGIGRNALNDVTAGSYNLAIGAFSCNALLTGEGNMALGYASLLSCTRNNNVAVGQNSGRSLVAADFNVFIGNAAGHTGQLATAQNTVGIGKSVITTKDNQVVIGNSDIVESVFQAELLVQSNTTLETSGAHESALSVEDSTGVNSFEVGAFLASTGNLSLGTGAGSGVTTGISNVLVGGVAGEVISSGNSNVMVGKSAGLLLETGNQNFGLGSFALSSLVGGSNNIAIGFSALDSLVTTASNHIGIGATAGRSLTGGSQGVFIGHSAGNNASQSTGAFYSVCIGVDSYTTGHNAIAIGRQATAGANQAVIGNTSIGTTILRGDVFTGDGAYETLKTTAKTANYTVADETFVKCDASTASFTVTLPSASSLVDTPIHFKKTDSSFNLVIIDGSGAETIDGELTFTLNLQYATVTVVSDGTEWHKIEELPENGLLTGSTTFGYNGSNQLTTVTSPKGVKTLTYSAGKLDTLSSTETNKLSTFNYTGDQLDSITVAYL